MFLLRHSIYIAHSLRNTNEIIRASCLSILVEATKERIASMITEAKICEYAKIELGFGEFELSVRKCAGQTCAKSIFSNPLIYEKCPQRLKYQKEGVSGNQSEEPKRVFVRVSKKQEVVPKFTGSSCNGCQFKAGSYCWGQCTMNVWKRKPDW